LRTDAVPGGAALVRAGLLTAVVDGLFSCVLSVAFYGSTATRLFQGVASTLIGPDALNGGSRTAAIGVLMHVGVAFTWSAVFVGIARAFPEVRRATASRQGQAAIASVYGPLIWLAMSLAVIPVLTHRPPAITFRWWVQLLGHFPFVGLPIVSMIGRGSAPEASARS